jgi:predicted RNA-binding protein with PIN domain
MKKEQIQKKIDQLYKEMKETALEIVDDMCVMHDHGATLTCVITSDLIEQFRKLDKQHTKYHEKLETA